MLVAMRVFFDPIVPRSSAHHIGLSPYRFASDSTPTLTALKDLDSESLAKIDLIRLLEVLEEIARHERIGVFDTDRHFGNDPFLDLVGEGLICFCTADDKHVSVKLAREFQYGFLGSHYFQVGAFTDLLAPGQNDVHAVWKRFPDRPPGVPAHYDSVAARSPLEELKVGRVVPRQLAAFSDGEVPGDGDDADDHVQIFTQSCRGRKAQLRVFILFSGLKPWKANRTKRSRLRTSPQSICLLSPTRRVTCVRSKYSRIGIAYFRDTPAISLNLPTSIDASPDVCACARSFSVNSPSRTAGK